MPAAKVEDAASNRLSVDRADSLTFSSTPDLQSFPQMDLGEKKMERLIPQLYNPSPESMAAFTKYILPSQLSLCDFHKVEECALHKSSIRQMAEIICNEIDNPRKLYAILFYLIKRGQRLSALATTLQNKFSDHGMDSSEYSLRFFLNVLLVNCSPFLRQKLITLLAASNPIPLDEYTLHNSTFALALIPEPYWVFEDNFYLLSYGLGTCKGKSSILNQIFGTTFEESNDTLYFSGTVDMQSDKMFIYPRNITVIDSHGTLSNQHKQTLLSVADGVIIHTSEQLWNNRTQLSAELDSLAVYDLKFILVLVRDVAVFHRQRNLKAFAPGLVSEWNINGILFNCNFILI
jgi:hypothetical protein